MTSDARNPNEYGQPRTVAANLLLVLTLILLVVGLPFFVFGAFLIAMDAGGAIDGGSYFAVGGLAAMLCGLGLKGHLRRQGAWF